MNAVTQRDPDDRGNHAYARRLSSAWLDVFAGLPGSAAGQLIRGRAYAREGRVGELHVGPGIVSALVRDDEGRMYPVTLLIPVLDEAIWDRLLTALVERVADLAALFDGELPAGSGEMRELLPGTGELRTACTCPDRASQPCRHVAAACYQVAALFDEDPFALPLLRGRSKVRMLTALRELRGPSLPAPPGVLASVAYRTVLSPLPGPLPGTALQSLSRPLYAGTHPPPPAVSVLQNSQLSPRAQPGSPARCSSPNRFAGPVHARAMTGGRNGVALFGPQVMGGQVLGVVVEHRHGCEHTLRVRGGWPAGRASRGVTRGAVLGHDSATARLQPAGAQARPGLDLRLTPGALIGARVRYRTPPRLPVTVRRCPMPRNSRTVWPPVSVAPERHDRRMRALRLTSRWSGLRRHRAALRGDGAKTAEYSFGCSSV